jgi:hypothetical protein
MNFFIVQDLATTSLRKRASQLAKQKEFRFKIVRLYLLTQGTKDSTYIIINQRREIGITGATKPHTRS